MKRVCKIIVCVILSIILQCGVLYYLDKVLFKPSKEVKVINVEVPTQSFDTDVEIPSNAEKIQVSYKGKYITYLIDGKVMLVNTKNSEVKEILEGVEILNIEWVPENNTLFIVDKKDGKVNTKTYNASNGVLQDVKEVCAYKEGMSTKSYISTSAIYVSVSNAKSTKFYRIDIDENVTKLDKGVDKIGSASAFWQKDVFVYEDLQHKRFYRYTKGESKKLAFSNSKNLTILKAAGNMIYMGELTADNKVSKIIYGEDEKDPSSWKSINLKESMEAKDIYINENNEIFIVYRLIKKIENITNGNMIPFEGEFISINNRVICSLDNNKITLKSVKDTGK